MGFFSRLKDKAKSQISGAGTSKPTDPPPPPPPPQTRAQASVVVPEGYRVLQRSGAAVLLQDEDDGTATWLLPGPDGDPWSFEETPASQVSDVWGPLSGPGDLEQFTLHMVQVDDAAEDPQRQLEIVQQYGYRDMETYLRTKYTFLKHRGTGDPNSPIGEFVFGEGLTHAMLKARMQATDLGMQQTAANNPQMLEPIEGVTMEVYAQISAAQAAGLDQEGFFRLLAQHGMDAAKWDRVSNGWQARMSQDTTATLAAIYSKAFAGAGQGQYGAAAVQASQATSGVGMLTGQAAGGAEPVPFEKLCEIQGAQTAWSAMGKDVNAMLQQVFGITAMDWSSMSMWWMTRMATDPNLMQRYADLSAKYEQQYRGGGGDPDSDISF